MLRSLLSTAALLLFTGTAFAHEFNVTLIVPAGSEAEALQAFLLASAERDGHANETSEGHLGGVDSQLEIVADGQVVPPSDVVVAIGEGALPDSDGIWSFRVTLVSEISRAEFLQAGAESFVRRYGARFGAAPTEIATHAYVAARLIDIAVRAQDGVDDISALEGAIRTY